MSASEKNSRLTFLENQIRLEIQEAGYVSPLAEALIAEATRLAAELRR